MQLKLLIADDEKELRAWIRLVLGHLEAAVFEASDGVELLSALKNEGPFDLVVTDLKMPGKSGLDAMAEARQLGITVGVILLTAFAGEVTVEMAERLGNVVILSKPVASRDLLAEATEIIRGSDRGRLPQDRSG